MKPITGFDADGTVAVRAMSWLHRALLELAWACSVDPTLDGKFSSSASSKAWMVVRCSRFALFLRLWVAARHSALAHVPGIGNTCYGDWDLCR
jgi:hypothetical protein